MSEKNDILAIQLEKKDGKLMHMSKGHQALYAEFIKNIEEGQKVEFFYQSLKDDGTNLQLAKIHACIRELASGNGSSFAQMKLNIKKEAGMAWDSPKGTYEMSFGKASKEDLGLVIEALIEVGDYLDVNLRGKFPSYGDQESQEDLPLQL